MDKLRITYEDPKSLILDPRNARLHPEPNQKAINFSLSEFDFRKVAICVWEKNRTVYAGNALVTEAIRRGYTEVPVAWIPKDWTEAKVKSFGIADNRSTELSEWDLPNLDAVLEEIKLDFDLNDLGFSEVDLDTLFADERKKEAEEDDFDTTPEAEAVSRLGDLWTLGRHRVLCGDCTVRENVERVMGGKKVDAVITDPPYGISVMTQSGKIGGGGFTHFGKIGGKGWVDSKNYPLIAGDDTIDAAQKSYFLCAGLGIENFIIWGGNHFTGFLPPSRGWIVWDKETTGNFSDAELAWTSYDRGILLYRWLWNGLSRKGDRTSEGIKRVHPTQKPVGLTRQIMTDFKVGEIILDPFLGSGTIMVASHQTDRCCLGIEINPLYCDVILNRMRHLGLTPIKIE